MGSGQSQLGKGGAAAEPPSPFAVEAGAVVHPMVQPAAVPAITYQLELATRALSAPTLVVLPTGFGKTPIALLVAAERLRQAGGFVLVLASTRALVRGLAEAFKAGLAEQAASRVEAVSASSPMAARKAAFSRAWVVVATPEAVVAEVEAGRLTLDRCSLMVVDDAHRAVGAFAYAEAARALRRDRPRALVLGLTTSSGRDRRRLEAVADALGLRRIDTRTRDDADVRPFVQPLAVEVIEVELTEELRRVEALLEAELQPRAWALTRLGVLPPVPLRFLGRRALVEAGEVLRKRHQHNRTVFFEALRTHGQAWVLVEALEFLEKEGAAPLVAYLERVASGQDAPQAERAVAAVPGVRDALKMAQALGRTPHPKVAALISEVQAMLRTAPGARALVLMAHREMAAALQEELARAPPLGPGLKSAVMGEKGGEAAAPVVIATGNSEAGPGWPRVDLVVCYDGVVPGVRALHRRAGGAAPRTLVLVARETRDESALALLQARDGRMTDAVRLIKRGGGGAWAPRGANATLPLELAPAAAAVPAKGRNAGGDE